MARIHARLRESMLRPTFAGLLKNMDRKELIGTPAPYTRRHAAWNRGALQRPATAHQAILHQHTGGSHSHQQPSVAVATVAGDGARLIYAMKTGSWSRFWILR